MLPSPIYAYGFQLCCLHCWFNSCIKKCIYILCNILFTGSFPCISFFPWRLKVTPWHAYAGREGRWSCSFNPSATSAAEGWCVQHHPPSSFTNGKDLVPTVQAGWGLGPVWTETTLPPSRFNPHTVQAVARNYTDYTVPTTLGVFQAVMNFWQQGHESASNYQAQHFQVWIQHQGFTVLKVTEMFVRFFVRSILTGAYWSDHPAFTSFVLFKCDL
jgi:hypothetical protein